MASLQDTAYPPSTRLHLVLLQTISTEIEIQIGPFRADLSTLQVNVGCVADGREEIVTCMQ
jgi:hypothetical protein